MAGELDLGRREQDGRSVIACRPAQTPKSPVIHHQTMAKVYQTKSMQTVAAEVVRALRSTRTGRQRLTHMRARATALVALTAMDLQGMAAAGEADPGGEDVRTSDLGTAVDTPTAFKLV